MFRPAGGVITDGVGLAQFVHHAAFGNMQGKKAIGQPFIVQQDIVFNSTGVERRIFT